jgi:hypothetical protein
MFAMFSSFSLSFSSSFSSPRSNLKTLFAFFLTTVQTDDDDVVEGGQIKFISKKIRTKYEKYGDS